MLTHLKMNLIIHIITEITKECILDMETIVAITLHIAYEDFPKKLNIADKFVKGSFTYNWLEEKFDHLYELDLW